MRAGGSPHAMIDCFVSLCFAGLVVLARSMNPIPSRTRPLNSSAPMVLWLKPWESRSLPGLPSTRNSSLRVTNTKRRFPPGGGVLVCASGFRLTAVPAANARDIRTLKPYFRQTRELSSARRSGGRVMKPFLLLMRFALLASAMLPPAIAEAQPKLEMHRTGVRADDGSGWHLAVSSKGSFSVLLPIPFNDFTTNDAATGETSYVVGGKSTEG